MGFDVGNQAFEFGVGLANFVVEFVGANELARGRVGVRGSACPGRGTQDLTFQS
jgi:hypothetical protein